MKSEKKVLVSETRKDEIEHANQLLKKGESHIPNVVVKIINFLTSHNIGFILSRNICVRNCLEARHERLRLGHKGIPLSDELKSLVFEIKDTGESEYISVHCRADMDIDFKKIREVLRREGTINELDEDCLNDIFGMECGTVNPFHLELQSNKLRTPQIFDKGVFKKVANLPGTMMTNAGDCNWAIEFDLNEIITIINSPIIEDITTPNKKITDYELPSRLNPKSIGIITGNGPDSGMELWRLINNEVVEIMGAHFLGDLSLPKVFMVSLPSMGLSMELDQREKATWKELSTAVNNMINFNVDILALACHTTHYFAEKIKELFEDKHRKFISMVDVVSNYISSNSINEFAFLGINYVADLGKWSGYSKLNQYSVEKLSQNTLRKFHELGYLVKQKGPYHKIFQQLIQLINNEIRSENIIIALTELSILYQSQRKMVRKTSHNVIDALELYGKAIARDSLEFS